MPGWEHLLGDRGLCILRAGLQPQGLCTSGGGPGSQWFPPAEGKTPHQASLRTRLTPETEAEKLGLDMEGGCTPLPEVQGAGSGLGA